MGWEIGDFNGRDIGYGVPAICDHPDCSEKIDRGLAYICANEEPYGGEHGCGLFFCPTHRDWKDIDDDDCVRTCERCADNLPPFEPKPDIPEWIQHKLTDESWQNWRDENTELVENLKISFLQYLVKTIKTSEKKQGNHACNYYKGNNG